MKIPSISILAIVSIALLPSVARADVLFPIPLHLTREVQDPLSGTTTRIEEYCVGSRVISIRDERTSIADYEMGELTEINRAAGTFSVTRFEQIAGTQRTNARQLRSPSFDGLAFTPLGRRGVGARSGDAFEARINDEGDGSRTIEVVIDRSFTLSKDAIEVLSGAAWPMQRGVESEVTIRAAAKENNSGRTKAAEYGLPLEHSVTFVFDNETLRTVNRVVRVGNELPSPELIAIPPGAREVPSPIVERERLLEELDQLPAQVQP